MKTLCLHSIHSDFRAASKMPQTILITSTDCEESPLVFWKLQAGEIQATKAAAVRKKANGYASLLYRESANANPLWLFAPLSMHVMHNGIRPLPLAIIEPGHVIAFEDQTWLITELWRPTPMPPRCAGRWSSSRASAAQSAARSRNVYAGASGSTVADAPQSRRS